MAGKCIEGVKLTCSEKERRATGDESRRVEASVEDRDLDVNPFEEDVEQFLVKGESNRKKWNISEARSIE
jgi:hypothetical protein